MTTRMKLLWAYRAFVEGDPSLVIDLCDEDVLWHETVNGRIVRRLQGHAEVDERLRLLARRVPILLRGVEVHRDALIFVFDEPWWSSSGGSFARLLGGEFAQTVRFEAAVKTISSSIRAPAIETVWRRPGASLGSRRGWPSRVARR